MSVRSNIRCGLVTLTLAAFGSPQAHAQSQTTFTLETINSDYSNVRGFNWIDDHAGSAPWNNLDTDHRRWPAQFAAMRGLGINTIRVWMPDFWAWIYQPALVEAKFGYLLDEAGRAGLHVVPILFDGVNFATSQRGSPEPWTATQWLRSPGELQVAPGVLVDWIDDPFGLPVRAVAEIYVRIFGAAYGSHPALLAWDVMNEPHDEKHVVWLETSIIPTLRSADPGTPITIGWAKASEVERVTSVDFFSYHTYNLFRAGRRENADGVAAVAARHGKPYLLTEAVNPGGGMSYASVLDGLLPNEGWIVFEALVHDPRAPGNVDYPGAYPLDLKHGNGALYGDGECRNPDAITAIRGRALAAGAPVGPFPTVKSPTDPAYVEQGPLPMNVDEEDIVGFFDGFPATYGSAHFPVLAEASRDPGVLEIYRTAFASATAGLGMLGLVSNEAAAEGFRHATEMYDYATYWLVTGNPVWLQYAEDSLRAYVTWITPALAGL